MAGELRNYDPDQIVAIWTIGSTGAAIDLTQGLIDGAGAIVEAKDAPAWTRKVDRNGNVVRNKNRNKSGTLTFTYHAESEIQDLLSPLYLVDETTSTIVGDIVIRDLAGATIMTYQSAFIEDDPTLSYGDTAGDRAYVFGYAKRIPNLRGAETL